MRALPAGVLAAIQDGLVIPAASAGAGRGRPLRRAMPAGADPLLRSSRSGGLAVGVHTTQFAIRDPAIGLFEPVLTLAREEMDRADTLRGRTADPHRRRLRRTVRPCRKRICWSASATMPGSSASPRWPTRTTTRSSRIARRSARASRSSASTCSPRWAADRCRTPSGAASPRFRPSSPSRSRPSIATRRSTSSARSWTPGATTSRSIPATTTTSSPTSSRPSGSPSAGGRRTPDCRRAARPLGRLDARRGGAARRVPGGSACGPSRRRCCSAASKSPTPTPRSSTPPTALPAALPASTKCCGGRGSSSTRCLDAHEVLSPGQADEIDRVYRAYPHLARRRLRGAHLDDWLRMLHDGRGRRCPGWPLWRGGLAGQRPVEPADLVVVNGKSSPSMPDSRLAEAVAVRDGRFVAVGTTDVRARIGATTRVIDARGRTVIPGLIDTHVHALGAAPVEAARRSGPAIHRRGSGLDSDAAKRSPPALDLDAARLSDTAARRPISHAPGTRRRRAGSSGRRSMAPTRSSLNTRHSGRRRHRRQPDPPGGVIVVVARGKPTGLLRNAARCSRASGPAHAGSAAGRCSSACTGPTSRPASPASIERGATLARVSRLRSAAARRPLARRATVTFACRTPKTRPQVERFIAGLAPGSAAATTG